MSDIPRRDWQTASGIFILALLVRLLFLFTSPDRTWPHSIFYEGDAPTWAEWAHALDEGKPFELDLPLRSPAVAYLLHWIHPGILQGPFTPHKALWCVFTSLACSLIYLACAMSLNRRVGLLAAGMYTFSFGSYVLSTTLNNEAPYTLALIELEELVDWCLESLGLQNTSIEGVRQVAEILNRLPGNRAQMVEVLRTHAPQAG